MEDLQALLLDPRAGVCEATENHVRMEEVERLYVPRGRLARKRCRESPAGGLGDLIREAFNCEVAGIKRPAFPIHPRAAIAPRTLDGLDRFGLKGAYFPPSGLANGYAAEAITDPGNQSRHANVDVMSH